jgi:Cytochrome oxidase complex assembly protein 1
MRVGGNEKMLDTTAADGEKNAMEATPPSPAPFTPGPQPQSAGWWSRNWKWFVPTGCCLTPLVLGGTFIAFLVLVVFGAMKQSDVYKMAVARAKADPRVTNALGTPISEGWFLSGKTNVNGGSGDADLSIPISGPKGKGTIYAVATKSGGEWSYSKLDVKIDSTGETIDLGP